jgi:hypothetical protein
MGRNIGTIYDDKLLRWVMDCFHNITFLLDAIITGFEYNLMTLRV